MDRSKQLGEGSILKLLVRFSVPAIIGMLVNALYNVVDRIFVGNSVGPLGIAGITIGFPIMLVMMACTMLIGLGATALFSIRLGEGKKEEAELIMGNALVLLIVVSVFMSVLGLAILDPMLRAFGASPEVLPYSVDFMRIILLGSVFMGVGFGMNNFIRGEGNPKTAMLTMLLGAGLNAILCPVFIFVLGLGIRGSALATVIAQGISAAWVLYYFLSGKSSLSLRRVNLRLRLDVVKSIAALGMAPFALQMAASLVNLVLNRSLVYYGGDTAVTGMGIITSVLTLIMMPMIGINQGAQPIIGYNYGARNYQRVTETLKLAIYAATAIAVVGFFFIETFPRQIVSLFVGDDPGVINFSVYALRTFLVLLPIIGFQIVSSGYFMAVGKARASAFLTLSRQLILLIPAILILPNYFDLHGVIIAGPVADLGSSILTGIWVLKELKQLEKRKMQLTAA